jgi:Domain of unknown function (DUF5916)
MLTSGFWGTFLTVSTDPSRRVVLGGQLRRQVGVEAGTHESEVSGSLRWRVSQRLVLQPVVAFAKNLDDLQYVETAETSGGPRYLLGRIDQDTLAVTFRADLQITPDLSIQYYGSPFVSTGRYTTFKRVTAPHADDYANRFHVLTNDELAYDGTSNQYTVSEAGAMYTFANPDFSFREFRSNLVTRWEFKPGSTMYVVWAQGRTAGIDQWDASLGRAFNQLWNTPASNVLLLKVSYWLSM